MRTASTGRTHGSTDQACDVKISLANPEPSTQDMPTALRNVRCWVNSGKHLLALSFSGFDPQQSFWASRLNLLIGWQNGRSSHPSGDEPRAAANALSIRSGKRLLPQRPPFLLAHGISDDLGACAAPHHNHPPIHK